jgi:ureidoacrylate peracid hydrolase
MHQLGILDEVRERLIVRRGGVAVFDRLSPRRTAHIVVDLQNGFMTPGEVAEVPVARAIVPNVNRNSAALQRRAGRNAPRSVRIGTLPTCTTPPGCSQRPGG